MRTVKEILENKKYSHIRIELTKYGEHFGCYIHIVLPSKKYYLHGECSDGKKIEEAIIRSWEDFKKREKVFSKQMMVEARREEKEKERARSAKRASRKERKRKK